MIDGGRESVSVCVCARACARTCLCVFTFMNVSFEIVTEGE